MAFVEEFIGSVTSGDSTKARRSASVRLVPAKARLWFAAADHAARLATDVGLLLASLNDAQDSDGSNAIYSYNVEYNDKNGSYAPPAVEDETFNSNSVRVSISTTSGGLPATDQIYIPQRNATALTMNTDGKSYDISASPFPNMQTQLLTSGLSKFNTAILSIIEAVPNDV